MRRDFRLYLYDILEAIHQIRTYLADQDEEAFKKDRKTQDAIIRNLEIIGDSEFRNACIAAPLYPGRLDAPKMRAILTEIELELRKTVKIEDVIVQNFSQLDIDHIMPQSWSEHWPLPDESKATWNDTYSVRAKQLAGYPLNERETAILTRQERIPTLGNLTLLNLSVNREAQHKAFKTKRDLLLANTTLRLNIPLLGYKDNDWSEETIKNRGENLADVALRVWPGGNPGTQY